MSRRVVKRFFLGLLLIIIIIIPGQCLWCCHHAVAALREFTLVHAVSAALHQVAADLWTKPIGLNYKPACRLPVNYTHHRHFIITQPESWYSFYHPTEGRRLSRPIGFTHVGDRLQMMQCVSTTLYANVTGRVIVMRSRRYAWPDMNFVVRIFQRHVTMITVCTIQPYMSLPMTFKATKVISPFCYDLSTLQLTVTASCEFFYRYVRSEGQFKVNCEFDVTAQNL